MLGRVAVAVAELWIVPADAKGTWTSAIPGHGGAWKFAIKQKFQELDIVASATGRDILVRNSRLRGTEIKMVITGLVGTRAWHHLFEGRIEGDRIAGELTISDGNNKRTFPWTATRAQ